MFQKIKSALLGLLGKGEGAALAQSSAWLFAAKIFGAASGYVFTYLIAQSGNAAGVGTFEIAFTFVILISVVARFGLDGAIVRYIGQFNAEHTPGAVRWLYKKSILFSGIFALIAAALLYFLAPIMADVFEEPGLINPLRWAAFAIPFFTLMNMNSETLRGYKKIEAYSVLQQGTVVFLAIFFLILLNKNEINAMQAFGFASFILFFISLFMLWRHTKHVPALQTPTISFNMVLKVASPIFLSSSIFMLISWTDTLMIGYYMADTDVGIYRVAFKISTLIAFTQFAINGIAAPMIAEMYHNKNMDGLRKLIHQIGWFNFMLSVPIFLAIAVAPSFLLGLFGAEFVAGRSILIVLSLGQVVFALAGPVLYILTMTKHEKTALHIMYVTAAINIVGNAVLIPVFGLLGAAVATASTTLIWNILAIIYVNKYIGVIAVPFLHRFLERKRD